MSHYDDLYEEEAQYARAAKIERNKAMLKSLKELMYNFQLAEIPQRFRDNMEDFGNWLRVQCHDDHSS